MKGLSKEISFVNANFRIRVYFPAQKNKLVGAGRLHVYVGVQHANNILEHLQTFQGEKYVKKVKYKFTVECSAK